MKLVIEEPESAALERHLAESPPLATSRIALVEVPRAVRLANPAPEAEDDATRLLESCMLIEIGDAVLRSAAGLASREIRTLDSIHLASALRIEADQLVAYDRRLLAAGSAAGLASASPGAPAAGA